MTKSIGRKCAAAIMAVTLVACWASASSATQSPARTTMKASSVTTVQFWSFDPGIASVVQLFNKTHPGIKVVLSDIDPEYAKLSAAIRAGNPPDVAQIEYMALPQYVSTGALLNLKSEGFEKYKSDFASWAWSEVSEGGGLWALPQDAGPVVMFYRKDIFAKYGISTPTTWAAFAQDAKVLHSKDPSAYITDFAADSSWFLSLMWQAGATWFGTNSKGWTVSINDAPSIKVSNYWQQLISEKLVKTDPDYTAQFWHDLATGNVATWLSGAWAADLIVDEAPSTTGDWGVAQLPNWNASSPASANYGGSSDVVFSATKVKAAALTFLAWLNATPQSWSALYSEVHLVPTYTSAFGLPAVNAKLSFFGGEDLAPVIKTASSRVNENFVWAPVTEAVFTEANDLYGPVVEGHGTLASVLPALQRYTITALQQGGYPVGS